MTEEYLIAIFGCHGATKIKRELSSAEYKTIRAIIRDFDEKGGGCNPTASIKAWDEAADWEKSQVYE